MWRGSSREVPAVGDGELQAAETRRAALGPVDLGQHRLAERERRRVRGVAGRGAIPVLVRRRPVWIAPGAPGACAFAAWAAGAATSRPKTASTTILRM